MALPNASGCRNQRLLGRRSQARQRGQESSKVSCQRLQEPQRPSARLMKAKEEPQQPNPVMALAAAQHAESQNPVLPPPTQNWRLPPALCLYPASAVAVSAHLRRALIAQVAVFLQRLVDDVFQL